MTKEHHATSTWKARRTRIQQCGMQCVRQSCSLYSSKRNGEQFARFLTSALPQTPACKVRSRLTLALWSIRLASSIALPKTPPWKAVIVPNHAVSRPATLRLSTAAVWASISSTRFLVRDGRLLSRTLSSHNTRKRFAVSTTFLTASSDHTRQELRWPFSCRKYEVYACM